MTTEQLLEHISATNQELGDVQRKLLKKIGDGPSLETRMVEIEAELTSLNSDLKARPKE